MKSFFSFHLDSLGFFVSVLCAVHCLAMPLFLLVLPTIGVSLINHELMESLIIGLSLLLVCSSLIRSYVLKHRKTSPIILALFGIFLLVLTRISHTDFFEIFFSVAGGLCIAFAHVKNWQQCRGFSHEHGEAENSQY